MPTPIIRLERLTKRYGHLAAVDDLSFEILEGEYICFLGPSGCGKTTTLRMIAGYVDPSGGRVILDGKDITHLPPQQRHMGMVFQSYALFPHMTVLDNVMFPLTVRNMPRALAVARADEMLQLVRLPDAGQKRPGELSGGQQQRVALARALSFQPRILLLDEPLGALDVKLREHMQLELKQIQKQLGVTTIHVTHDQEEALSLSDRVVVMNEGQLAQFATPPDLYMKPVNRYVADFVGKINFLPVMLVSSGETAVVQVTGAGVQVELPGSRIPGPSFTLGVRPEDLALGPIVGADLKGTVEKVKFVGAEQMCFVRVGPELLLMVRDLVRSAREGETVGLRWQLERLHVFAS